MSEQQRLNAGLGAVPSQFDPMAVAEAVREAAERAIVAGATYERNRRNIREINLAALLAGLPQPRYPTTAALIGDEPNKIAVRELNPEALWVGDQPYSNAPLQAVLLAEVVNNQGGPDAFAVRELRIDDRMLQMLPIGTQVLAVSPKPTCGCHTCRPVTLSDMRMVLCPDCGNKRCPRANDHRNACTGSNEPGQPGSAYPASPMREEETGKIAQGDAK